MNAVGLCPVCGGDVVYSKRLKQWYCVDCDYELDEDDLEDWQ